MNRFERVLRTGLSSLWDRAASRLAALRFNPSREDLLDLRMSLDALAEGETTADEAFDEISELWRMGARR